MTKNPKIEENRQEVECIDFWIFLRFLDFWEENLDLDRFFFHFCRSVKSFVFSVKFSKRSPHLSQRAKKLVHAERFGTNFLARCDK